MWPIKKEQSLKGTGDKTRIKIPFGITSFSTSQQFTITHSVHMCCGENSQLKLGFNFTRQFLFQRYNFLHKLNIIFIVLLYINIYMT